jgi:phospholipid-transporting ATPase
LIADVSTATSADPVLLRILQDPTLRDTKREAIHDFLLTLSACNTVVPTKVSKTTSGALEMEIALGTDDAEETKLEYQGESPDEVALVSAAASYGYTLLSRTSSYIVLNVLGDTQR